MCLLFLFPENDAGGHNADTKKGGGYTNDDDCNCGELFLNGVSVVCGWRCSFRFTGGGDKDFTADETGLIFGCGGGFARFVCSQHRNLLGFRFTANGAGVGSDTCCFASCNFGYAAVVPCVIVAVDGTVQGGFGQVIIIGINGDLIPLELRAGEIYIGQIVAFGKYAGFNFEDVFWNGNAG